MLSAFSRHGLRAFAPTAAAASTAAPAAAARPAAFFRTMASPNVFASMAACLHPRPSPGRLATVSSAVRAATPPAPCLLPGRALARSMGCGIKTHSGAKKRFKVTASGKIIRPSAGKKHNTGKHNRAKIRGRGQTQTINGKKHDQQIRKLLGGLSSMIV